MPTASTQSTISAISAAAITADAPTPDTHHRIRFQALDAAGREAIRSLRTESRPWSDLPRFIVAWRDHLLCLTDSTALLKSVAEMAGRPGNLSAFTHNCLQILLPAGNDTATRACRRHLRKLAETHNVSIISSSHQ